jgi:cellulose synthase/poly-beta-1,6-N-acetylglucosamine synthase-like glycosyltransferase
MLATSIIGILIFLYGLILLFYRQGWRKSQHFFTSDHYTPSKRFSIIIAARNEAIHIGNCLNSLQQQNYPKSLYEIIVIDDHSEDQTAEVVKQYHNVMLIHLSDYNNTNTGAYKKQAIALGISKSSGEYIITTDADCIVPKNWLRCFDQMIQQNKTACIAAPVSFQKEKNLLQIFESLDFMMLQGITAAAVQSGIHTMSNGANLCYRKSAFEKVGGFSEADQIASGDDMLLMQKIKQLYPNEIYYCKSKDAIVITQSSLNISSFISQRIRWASKGKYYKEAVLKIILSIVFLLNLAMLGLIIGSVFSDALFCVTAISVGIKVILEVFFLYPVSTFFGKQRLLWFFIPLQPFHIVYMVAAAFMGNLTKYHWKGRLVR